MGEESARPGSVPTAGVTARPSLQLLLTVSLGTVPPLTPRFPEHGVDSVTAGGSEAPHTCDTPPWTVWENSGSLLVALRQGARVCFFALPGAGCTPWVWLRHGRFSKVFVWFSWTDSAAAFVDSRECP